MGAVRADPARSAADRPGQELARRRRTPWSTDPTRRRDRGRLPPGIGSSTPHPGGPSREGQMRAACGARQKRRPPTGPPPWQTPALGQQAKSARAPPGKIRTLSWRHAAILQPKPTARADPPLETDRAETATSQHQWRPSSPSQPAAAKVPGRARPCRPRAPRNPWDRGPCGVERATSWPCKRLACWSRRRVRTPNRASTRLPKRRPPTDPMDLSDQTDPTDILSGESGTSSAQTRREAHSPSRGRTTAPRARRPAPRRGCRLRPWLFDDCRTWRTRPRMSPAATQLRGWPRAAAGQSSSGAAVRRIAAAEGGGR